MGYIAAAPRSLLIDETPKASPTGSTAGPPGLYERLGVLAWYGRTHAPGQEKAAPASQRRRRRPQQLGLGPQNATRSIGKTASYWAVVSMHVAQDVLLRLSVVLFAPCPPSPWPASSASSMAWCAATCAAGRAGAKAPLFYHHASATPPGAHGRLWPVRPGPSAASTRHTWCWVFTVLVAATSPPRWEFQEIRLTQPDFQQGEPTMSQAIPPAASQARRQCRTLVRCAWLLALFVVAGLAAQGAQAGDDDSERENLARIAHEIARLQAQEVCRRPGRADRWRVKFRYDWLQRDLQMLREGVERHADTARQPRPKPHRCVRRLPPVMARGDNT